MNLLFKRKHIYKPKLTADKVQHKLSYICNRRFEDYSVDLIGNVHPDGSFELTNKWGFTEKEWIENRQAYLQGGLKETDNAALVEIKLRPNIIFICLFYIGLILLGLELCNLKVLPLSIKELRIGIIAFYQLVLIIMMIRVTNSLRNRFERLMQLN